MDVDDDFDVPELKELNYTVVREPDNYEAWEKLVKAAESLDGGINRNSAPQAITAIRSIYDRFLAQFPLFFGYWKKYADLEFAVAGTEAAELVYERGIASITNSVDLWTNYCSFKVETCHDADLIRELFDRAANSVGLDFLAHLFWDKYLEFEERLEAWDHIFAILSRIIHIPMHQYARYFERFRSLAQAKQCQDIAPAERVAQFKAEIEMEAGGMKNEVELDGELRRRIDAYHIQIFQQTQTETNKRWTYESEVKRPYFHVTELDEAQLSNWRKYLDFEESEGDFGRITFLYERCLVAAAYYDEFWLRYARWMFGQINKIEEVRNIYMRASCIYAPIARPAIRLQWALFEEMNNRVDVANAIYEAILIAMPSHVETVIAWANSVRRHSTFEEAVDIYKTQVESDEADTATKAALIAEWARLLWRIKGSPSEARELYKQSQAAFLDSRDFWKNYLAFELEQRIGSDDNNQQTENVKSLFETIKRTSKLSVEALKELAGDYMAFLLERGGAEAAKEYLTLDREINK